MRDYPFYDDLGLVDRLRVLVSALAEEWPGLPGTEAVELLQELQETVEAVAEVSEALISGPLG